MKNLILFSIPIIFIFSNCTSDKGEEISEPEGVKWMYSLDPIDSNSGAFLWDPIIVDDIIILPRKRFQDQGGELIALNKHNGDLIWTWNEAFEKYGRDGFEITSHVHDGILAIGDDSYTAGIDINTGETIWENKENVNSYSAINGIDEFIFKSSFVFREKFWVQKASIRNGEWETIYELDKVEGFNLDTYTPTAVEWENKIYLTFLDIRWPEGGAIDETDYFLNFYNVTDDRLEWRSDKIPLNNPLDHTPGIFPVFNDGQILLANTCIYSYNMSDGNLSWKNSYDNSFALQMTLSAKNGKVYGNSTGQYFICLDVKTGQEYFRTNSGGSPSRIKIHDNKCYMSSVNTPGSNRLMVIDAVNGDVIESIESPHKDLNEIAVFDESIAVDNETGYVYTNDHKFFLCYDFE